MKTRHMTAVAAVALALLGAPGCKPLPLSEVEQERDYREMIARARRRQEATAGFQALEHALREFQVHLGRYPTNLSEVVRAGYIDSIPPPPPGTGYSYDPTLGNIRIMRLPPQGAGQGQQQKN